MSKRKLEILFSIIVFLAVVMAGKILVDFFGSPTANVVDMTTDAYTRDRVVMLKGADGGQCTGVQVVAPSGLIYILTAAHCETILASGKGFATLENGKRAVTVEIAKDEDSDLMLMTPVSADYLTIADSAIKYQHVHTMTHGNGLPTYRTDGSLLEPRDIRIVESFLQNMVDILNCERKKNHVVTGEPPVCLKSLHLMTSSASVIPGSSGGPLLDAHNRVVGIASATNPGTGIGYFVTLSDIKKFLKNR